MPTLVMYWDEISIYGDPVAGIRIPGASGFVVEPLPDNEHKGSVRVEVLNAAEGIVASGWASYHLVCVPGSDRPDIVPGMRGVGVTAAQAAIPGAPSGDSVEAIGDVLFNGGKRGRGHPTI